MVSAEGAGQALQDTLRGANITSREQGLNKQVAGAHDAVEESRDEDSWAASGHLELTAPDHLPHLVLSGPFHSQELLPCGLDGAQSSRLASQNLPLGDTLFLSTAAVELGWPAAIFPQCRERST